MDPLLEFEAPKWFDFVEFASKEESGDANSSLNSSFFDHPHPLHESQDSLDKEKIDGAISSNSNKQNTFKRQNSVNSKQGKISTKSNRKLPNKKSTFLNTKKSLGVKSTIRVKRGDRTVVVKENSKSALATKNVKDNDHGRKTPDALEFNVKHVFTPPFSPTVGNDLFSPEDKKLSILCDSNVLNSPLRVPCCSGYLSPEYKPIMSPVRSNFALEQRPHLKASVSHHPSVKISSKANAVTKATVQGGKNATCKRRKLPAIPVGENEKKQQSPHLRLNNPGKDNEKYLNQIKNQVSVANDMQRKLNHQNSCSSLQAASDTMIKTCKVSQENLQHSPLRESESAEPSIEDMLREHNKKVYKEKSKYNKFGHRVLGTKNTASNKQDNSVLGKCLSGEANKLSTVECSVSSTIKEKKIKESDEISNVITKLNTEVASFSDCQSKTSDELSIQEMLLQHQKKIMSGKCKYDINGRRIQSGTPSFCPAPISTSTTDKPSSSTAAKYTRRSCVAAPTTSHPNTSSVGKKRLANSTSSCATAKQKRRSFVETSAASHSTAECSVETTKSRPKLRSSCSTSTLSHSVTVDSRRVERQKRRSCMNPAASSSGDAGDTEREIREMIARHNSRIAAKK